MRNWLSENRNRAAIAQPVPRSANQPGPPGDPQARTLEIRRPFAAVWSSAKGHRQTAVTALMGVRDAKPMQVLTPLFIVEQVSRSFLRDMYGEVRLAQPCRSASPCYRPQSGMTKTHAVRAPKTTRYRNFVFAHLRSRVTVLPDRGATKSAWWPGMVSLEASFQQQAPNAEVRDSRALARVCRLAAADSCSRADRETSSFGQRGASLSVRMELSVCMEEGQP